MGDRSRNARIRPAAYPVLFGVGAVLGTALDQVHVRGGVEVYRDPSFAGQAWWVPPEFGLVYAAGVGGVASLGRPAPSGRSARALLGEVLWFSAVYVLTALADHRPAALTVALVALALVRAGALRDVVAHSPLPAVLLVTGGPLVEAILVSTGLFSYTRAQLGNIPLWLPLLYVHALPFSMRMTETALHLFGPAPRPTATT